MLCAKLAARHVLLTDYEPLVVDRMRSNAQLNGLQGVCAFQALDWLDLSTLAPAQRRAHDLLLLADVIYAAAVVRPLVDTLLALLQPGTGERRGGGCGAAGRPCGARGRDVLQAWA